MHSDVCGPMPTLSMGCDLKGIKRELTAPYNPPQNGVLERMNRTIQEKVHSMLSNADWSNGFWAEALATCPSH